MNSRRAISRWNSRLYNRTTISYFECRICPQINARSYSSSFDFSRKSLQRRVIELLGLVPDATLIQQFGTCLRGHSSFGDDESAKSHLGEI